MTSDKEKSVFNTPQDDAQKLEALRAAVDLGLAALDRGAFKEFADASAMVAHLNDLANRQRAGGPEPTCKKPADVL
jgi:hypothetical protein